MKFQDNPTWHLADRLHGLLCQRGHQMDQCWGLHLPYDENKPEMSSIQEKYVIMAERIMDLMCNDEDMINTMILILKEHKGW